MTTMLHVAVGVLVVNIVVALWRVLRGPETRDRLSGLLLLATVGSAVLVVLATSLGQPALRDAALAVVALATVIVVVRVVEEGPADGSP